MPKLDLEPCPVEVPVVREKHIGFRFNKPGRGTVFVRPRDFSVWLSPRALRVTPDYGAAEVEGKYMAHMAKYGLFK
jgi:hypothetical protein